MKYRYVYIDKIGRFFLRARPGYSFGSTLHRVLEAFHREGGTHSADQVLAHYEDKWIPAGYESTEQEEEFRTAGIEIMQAYHASAAERRALEVETLFTEKTIKTDMGPFILSGRVDRIDRHPDGTLEVVDYKSGRLETTPEEVADELAMNIYQTILRREYPGTRVIATIYCLRSGVHASAELSDANAEQFATDIRAIGEEVISRDFEGVRPVRIEACEYCDFLPKCQRYWREQARFERLDG